MDILYFLKERTKFIRYFYDTAGKPFRELMRKIEASEAPFQAGCTQDGEPPFLAEWLEANSGLETLGRNCVSMLSASLQLYFMTWEKELGVVWEEKERKRTFENGFVQGYRTCFGQVLKLSWDDCPVNFDILEQVVLARNRDQHPDHIARLDVTHDKKFRTKHPALFFVSEGERKMFDDPDMANIYWMSPKVHVSRDNLLSAINQVEALGEWLEERMFAALHRTQPLNK